MAGTSYSPSPTVPLGYHKAFNYVLLPIGIIIQLIGLFSVTSSGLVVFINLCLVGLMIATMVGMLKFQRWSFVTLLILVIIELVVYVILFFLLAWLLSLYGSAMSYMGSTLSYYGYSTGGGIFGAIASIGWIAVILCIAFIAMSIFTLVYYIRRKNLFFSIPNQYQVTHGAGTMYGATGSAYGANYGQPVGSQPYQSQQSGAPFAGQAQQQPAAAQPQPQVGKKFCSHCGAEIANLNNKFCSKCGTPVK